MKNNTIQSPFEILNIEFDTTPRDIKRAYKKLVRKYSPEHSPQMFIKIREAYEFITKSKYKSDANFPVYRKPLETFLAKNKKKITISFPNSLLSEIFETPFDTNNEIRNFWKKGQQIYSQKQSG